MNSTREICPRLALLVLCAASCGAGRGSTESAASASPPSGPIPDEVAACPQGGWRLSPQPVLANVVLWLSQVLVRYADAPLSGDVTFSFASWHSASPPPTRTRSEALALARQIAALARRDPQSFPQLARTYSEDITTKSTGGALGGVQAQSLGFWPQLLDCVALLKPGDTSDVIETKYGFHVFHRSPTPPEVMVSGAEIVIAHDDAGWLEVVNGRPSPKRSRADALNLANRVYDQAKADPGRFAQLVARYSEHADARLKGDFGRWSTREPTPFPREIAALASLRVGDVAPPLDSPFGFRILQRTADRPREQLAMSSIRLAFNEADPRAEETTRTLVTMIADAVRKEPKRFAELQRQHCCTEVEQWEDGRGSVALTEVLASQRIGQTRLDPVRADGTYVLPRRVRPRPPARIEPLFDLPTTAPAQSARVGAPATGG